MGDLGDEIIGGSMAQFQLTGPAGYRDFMNFPWEGEAAIIPFSDDRSILSVSTTMEIKANRRL